MTTLAAALIALAAPLCAQAVSTAPAALSTAADAGETDVLASAVGLYDAALSDFRAGREDAGRAGLKNAFSALVDGLDDDDIPAALRPDFAAMIDKARNWPDAESQGPAAPDLDVPESALRAAASTATVKMRGVRVDPDNPIAQKFIAIYTRQRPASVEAALARSGRYRDMIAAELKRKGLPPELLYLVMVESEYRPDAVSPSGAAGLWQFMPGTARKYGLEVSYWVDERYDPVKSTRAAARYLSDLYRWFGDWELALAAYNRGEGGIGRDLRYSRSLDFDGLSGKKALPSETDHYVPKFMACVLIGRDPQEYGLHPKYETPEPYDEAILPRDLDLGVAAKCAGTTEASLRRLNPELRAWCTPKDRPGFALRLPAGTKASFEAALAKVTDWNPGPTMVRYKVRRGDSLGKIAKLYHTTVKSILANNKIRSARLIRPGSTLVIKPGRAHSSAKKSKPSRRRRKRRR
ncbi:MAG: transglycosylase SLT domain-containing protein [Elusimicrobia bacterium]|nr:transglycosylase SLT domain-containing protein [Elusimicrobiota bacterium]